MAAWIRNYFKPKATTTRHPDSALRKFLQKYYPSPFMEPLPSGILEFDEFLHSPLPEDTTLENVPSWVTGHISLTDTRFLHNMILREKPESVLEIGVASGYSTSVILSAVSRLDFLSKESLPWVYSIDLLPSCYFAPERETGSAIYEITPKLSGHAQFFLGQTAPAARNLKRNFSLAFVDGNHQHPWPVFDLLALWPVMKPGSWVVLHDIFLPILNSQSHSAGPALLFALWPGNKLLQSPNHETRNMGAIQLPDDKVKAIASLALLLNFAWECQGPSPELQEIIMAPYLSGDF